MKSNFERFLKRIQNTQAEEIDCSACLDQISQYVDVELDDGDAAGKLPLVHQHLDQCGVCMEEYQVLRDLARLERDGGLPSKEELVDRLKGHQEGGSTEKPSS